MIRLYIAFVMIFTAQQQKVALPHGMSFGQKVDELQKIPATKLDSFMAKKSRISTTIFGKVLGVDTVKGGWFRMNGGNGQVINVHFKNYQISIPKQLRGRTVMIQGVAQRVVDSKAPSKTKLTFEASGLTVE